MRLINYGAACSAAAVMMSAAVFAQSPAGQGPVSTPSPTQVQRPAPGTGSTAAGEMVTITGCVQREADFRKAADAGKGGVAGTGVGVGNEFVLTSASMASQNPTSAGAGAAAMAFELTGEHEGQVAAHVGKRVEVMGTLKGGETSAAGPTGGPTAGAPPRGIDVASKDLKLRELEVASVKAATGSCPA